MFRCLIPIAAGFLVAGSAAAQGTGSSASQSIAASAAAGKTSTPLVAQACAGCHGQNGAGQAGTPKLAGINREQFVKLWSEFRGNERPNTIMGRISRGYTDAEAATLADYFSAKK